MRILSLLLVTPFLITAAACLAPEHGQYTCTTGGTCPAGLYCVDGFCQDTPGPLDASSADLQAWDTEDLDTDSWDQDQSDAAPRDVAFADQAGADSTGPDASQRDGSAADNTSLDSNTSPDHAVASDRNTPDRVQSDAGFPDHRAPDGASVDGALADGFHPDTYRPDTYRPDTSPPDTSSPDTYRPDASSPDTYQPDNSLPDSQLPDTTLPDTAQPDADSADAGGPLAHVWSSDVRPLDSIIFAHVEVGQGDDIYMLGDGYTSITGSVSGLGDAPIYGRQHGVFIVRYNSAGTPLWYRGFGNHIEINDIAVTATGKVYAVGHFDDPIDFGDGVVNPVGTIDNMFIAHYDGDGQLEWLNTYYDRAQNRDSGAIAVEIDPQGNLAVLLFGGGRFDIMGSNNPDDWLDLFWRDFFIARYTQTGDYIDHGDSLFFKYSSTYIPTMNIGPAGQVLLYGSTYNGSDLQVAQYSSSYNLDWSTVFANSDQASAGDLAIATDGTVYLTGGFQMGLDLGSPQGEMVSQGGVDLFVAAFDGNGAWLWNDRYGDGDHQTIHDITIDGHNNLWLTGYLTGTIDWGGFSISGLGTYRDAYIAKLDSGGQPLWSERYGNSDHQEGNSITCDSSNAVLVAGKAKGTINFGGPNLTKAFIAKMQ